MTYFIYARDGASVLVLRRETLEAAGKKAAELEQCGYFEVRIEDKRAGKAA